MLVLGDGDGLATFAAGHLNRFKLVSIKARGLCLGVVPLAGEGKAVALLAGNLEVARNVVSGLRHGVVAIDLRDLLVGEAGADGRIEDLHVAAERLIGLTQRKGGTAHAFHAARHKQVALAGIDRPRGIGDGGQTTGAKPVHGDSADRHRKP